MADQNQTTDDLPSRLRRIADGGADAGYIVDRALEAADEIVRLRAELAEAEAALEKLVNG